METIKKLESAKASQRLLIAAHIFALGAYALALQFLLKTTGGTVFLFTSLAPLFIGASVLIIAGIAIHRFTRRHSLFAFEIYQPGEIVFEQGEIGDCAYFIHTGEVEVVANEEGQQKVVATLREGEYFGETALITSHPRNATVRAVSATKLAVLGKKNFLTMMNVMPSARSDFMQKVSERALKNSA